MPTSAPVRDPRPIVPNYAKGKRSNKAPAVKAAVIAQRTQGTQKSTIARNLKITRPTVDAILAEANIDEQMTSGTVLCAELIPESVRVIKHRLSQNSESAAFGILNPFVLSKVGSMPGGSKMTVDIHLQQAIGLITPQPAPSEPVKTIEQPPEPSST